MDPTIPEMLEWIAGCYNMNRAALSRMFQASPSTVSSWLKTGRVSYRNYKKIRASYYYLHDTKDPHAGERRCLKCKRWLKSSEFRNSSSLCRSCERNRTSRRFVAQKRGSVKS